MNRYGIKPNFVELCTLCMFLIIGLVGSFNIDVTSPLIFNDNEGGSWFGQALTLHQHGSEKMLVVGAPKAQSNFSEIVRGGVAYKCSFTNTNTSLAGSCTEIQLDNRGNDFEGSSGVQLSNKTDQRLGAVIASGGPKGPLVICRPRYQYYYESMKRDRTSTQKRDLLGGCFVLSQENFESPNILLPCISGGDRRCQFGFSVAAGKDHIVYGAVGVGRYQGQFWTSNSGGRNRMKRPAKKIAFTKDLEDTYMGYSVALGNFSGGSLPEYAVAIPRYQQVFGKVVLYDSSLTEYLALENRDMGSYFGHTLVACDLNNDGWDDLLVGAPFFTDSFSQNGTAWEIGKVFIYYNDREGGFSAAADISTGRDTGGRFGYAATSLGDINIDGFNDLAIAAPFVDEGNAGKVFIYHGIGRNVRIPLVPVQVLQSSQFGQKLVPFGSALSARVDVDGNVYPDLAVGAYKSQVAVVYRSRPSFTASIQIYHRSRLINLDELNHLILHDGKYTTGFNFSVCFTFLGHGMPQTMSMDYTISLDASRVHTSRALFTGSHSPTLQGSTIASTEGNGNCVPHTAYIKPTIRDKQTPIAVVATYSYPESRQAANTPPGYLVPVLSRWAVTRTTLSIPFKRNCKSSTCSPNLIVDAQLKTPFVVHGDSGDVYMAIDVVNDGEDSFHSVLEIDVPEDVFYTQLDRANTDSSITTCSVSQGRVTCDIGNPIKAGERVMMGIFFKAESLTTKDANLVFALTAHSGDDNIGDANRANVSIPVISAANITLTGAANPELVIFKETEYPLGRNVRTLPDVGPQLTHTVSLTNGGPSFLGATEIVISFPLFPVRGGQLLYPVKARMDNSGECFVIGSKWNAANFSSDVNYRHRHRRSERSTDTERAATSVPRALYSVSCSNDLSACQKIVCYVDSLGAGVNSARDEVEITLTSRLDPDLLIEYNITNLNLTIRVDAKVTKSLYPTNPFRTPPAATIQISTIVLARLGGLPRREIPYWVYSAAVVGGLFIQLVLIVILNKIGFFKRKKISPKPRHCVPKDNGPTLQELHADIMIETTTPLEANPLHRIHSETR